MIQKFFIGFLALILIAASVFSFIGNTSSQEGSPNTNLQNSIPEQHEEYTNSTHTEIVEQIEEESDILPDTTTDNSTDKEALSDNTLSGTVEVLSSGVLNLTTNEKTIPIFIGNGTLDNNTSIDITDGDLISIDGYWSASGNFIAESINNLTNNTSLDIAQADLTTSTTTAATNQQNTHNNQSNANQGGQKNNNQQNNQDKGGNGYRGGR